MTWIPDESMPQSTTWDPRVVALMMVAVAQRHGQQFWAVPREMYELALYEPVAEYLHAMDAIASLMLREDLHGFVAEGLAELHTETKHRLGNLLDNLGWKRSPDGWEIPTEMIRIVRSKSTSSRRPT